MNFKRYLYFALIISILIFSISFVSANEDLTNVQNANTHSLISVDDNVIDDSISIDNNAIDENLKDIEVYSIDDSSVSMDLSDDSDINESEKSLTTEAKKLKANKLGAELGEDIHVSGNTAQDVENAIFSAQPGDRIFLDNRFLR